MTVNGVSESNGSHGQLKTVFVVGLGMVGIAFVEKLLNLDEAKQYKIVTVGEEAHLAYNRVQLTDYMEHRSVEKLYLNSPEWYMQHEPERFEFHTGQLITDIDVNGKQVKTNTGHAYHYDILVLATGSDALYPPYMSPERAETIEGVFVYRNISDLNKLIAYADSGDVNRASVVGGGLIGLEAAKAIYDLPTVPDMSIINRSGWPLSRQLDQEAGDMVTRKIEAMGVEVVTNVDVKDVVLKAGKSASGKDIFGGFELDNGNIIEADLTVFTTGIKPRDELAKKAGLECHRRGGVVVNNFLQTSAPDIYAIGECASWKGNFYGLIGPGVEMADILSFNLTQTDTKSGTHKAREMNDPDLSTKLKLMGVDVASFGDFFADQRANEAKVKKETHAVRLAGPATSAPITMNGTNHANKPAESIRLLDEASRPGTPSLEIADGVMQKRLHPRAPPRADEPIKCLTYKDPFASVYKKYIFTADGKKLLGGMMIGDTSDFIKLVSIVKKKKQIDVEPHQFIIGQKSGEDDGADLDDDTVVCSCHAVTKGAIGKCVKEGITALGDIKTRTKAGTGCGGCMPLITNIFKSEMKKAGLQMSTDLCPHFKMSRMDLYSVIKIKKLKTFKATMQTAGTKKDSIGCEICKPAVGSILASLYNEHVMDPSHHANQDTNDRFMANIQRNGTFSVVPRVTGGEIQPDHLIALGQVAKKYNLYSKITGGQRIDLFGAQKADLPAIWKALNDAGLESGLAYGKSLRTVKSCVGSTWCRYGIGDSVGLAIQLENRYKVLRAPHKIKGGVSGCVRECAEAQSKDFGLIATDKGWNIFVAGNGGAIPRHAQLFAQDVPPSLVTKILDRYLMLYIRMADKLMRTARWIESFEGGIEKLRKIIIEDELGICDELDKEMAELVDTYVDEWSVVTKDPERQKQFRQFVNTDERVQTAEPITERGQQRPADWPKDFPSVRFRPGDLPTPKEKWQWIRMASLADLSPTEAGTTSCAVRYGDTQLAIFRVPGKGLYATQQMCPHKRFFGLEHGIVGDDPNTGKPYVSCPLHKRNFTLTDGECLNDEDYSIMSFNAKDEDGAVHLLLPPKDELDAMLGTEKWMLKAATADALGKNAATQIEITGPSAGRKGPSAGSCATHTNEDGKSVLSW